jgi:ABC-type sugar transport system permease subunit
MTLEKDDRHIELTDEQIADLKKAIADLAEDKRVSPDKLNASEFIGTDNDPSASRNDADNTPPLFQHFLWRNKWPVASGIVGIVLGFLLSVLLT